MAWKAGRNGWRWVLLGLCSSIWILTIFVFYSGGRGGIFFLAGKSVPRESFRKPEKPDGWAEAFLAWGDDGWEWMIAEPGELQNKPSPHQVKTLEEKVRSQTRKGIPSAWFDSVPSLVPLRRKVEPDGRVASELLATTGYQSGEDLMEHLAGMGGGTIKAMAAGAWQVTWHGTPLLCQWREATGAVNEPNSRQVRGWLLVRPGMEESSRP